jgi:UDP-N-acetylmuramate--alanine ligase
MPADAKGLLTSGRRRVHIVGVAGAGMSAIAAVLVAMGHDVSGSDLRENALTDRLARLGVAISVGHAAEHVVGAEVLTASPAIASDNVELDEARRLGVPVLTRAAVLAAIASIRRAVAVAGTHGKTTTASMLTLALSAAGLRPSFLVGADVGELGTNGLLDDGPFLVLEADESYGSFAELSPEVTLLTSVEPDHLDYYGTPAALRAAFARLLAATSSGRLVGADDAGAASVGREFGALLVGEAAGADYRIVGLELSKGTVRFVLTGPTGHLGPVTVPVPGRHNARNAALAAATALELGAGAPAVEAALSTFTGAPRRYELRGEAGGVTFVDDYGHLPGEVQPTLATARLGGYERVVAVFQPHRYTRTAALAADFAHAFDAADVVVVTDVYSAGEPPIEGVSGRLVADAVAAARPGAPVHYAPDRAGLRELVASLLRPGDVCVTLGAGDLTTLPDELLAARCA